MIRRSRNVVMGIALVALGVGCARKQVTNRDRLEAAHVVSEARFALSVREWARAEALLARAVELAPQGDYWMTLGGTRVKLNDRAGAKAAYLAALQTYGEEASRSGATPELLMKQAYVLALLGRQEEGRALIVEAAKRFPLDQKLLDLTDPAAFAKMMSSPRFKDMAL